MAKNVVFLKKQALMPKVSSLEMGFQLTVVQEQVSFKTSLKPAEPDGTGAFILLPGFY